MFWAVAHDEGRLAELAALICHPNPLFGGTMHNKVVYQTAKTFSRCGVPVLRFNFRGVGLSEGVHDNGRGEKDDAAAAIAFIADEYPGAPILLAGFSFGAAVGLRAGCAEPRVTELIGLGLPIQDVGSEKLAYLRDCKKPKLLLSGALDVHSPRENMEALAKQFPPEVKELTRVEFIPNADHFFTGHLAELDRAIVGWLTARHPVLVANEK